MRTHITRAYKFSGYDLALLTTLQTALRDDATGILRRGMRALAVAEGVPLPDPYANHPLPAKQKKKKKQSIQA